MAIEMPKERPTGVTVLGSLAFIMAGVTFFQAIAIILGSLVSFEWGMACCAAPFFLVVLLYLSIGGGLLMMLRWAWFWGMLLAGLGLILGIGNLVSTAAFASEYFPDGVPAYYWAFPVLQVVVNLPILLHLFTMREHFRDLSPEGMAALQQQQRMRMGGGMMPPMQPPAQPPAEPPTHPPEETPPVRPPPEPPKEEPPEGPPQR